MTLPRLKLPPKALAKTDPELYEYLVDLVKQVEGKINTLDDSQQTVGRPVKFPLIADKSEVISDPFTFRPGQYPIGIYLSNYSGDPCLLVSDGTQFRTITIGPPLV